MTLPPDQSKCLLPRLHYSQIQTKDAPVNTDRELIERSEGKIRGAGGEGAHHISKGGKKDESTLGLSTVAP